MPTLFDLIESTHLEAQEPDSIIRNKPRYRIAHLYKEALPKMEITFATHTKAMNVRIPASCTVYKPTGYEFFIRAYLIDCNGKTIEIKRNDRVPSEVTNFLVDCDGTLMRDCDGTEVTTQCLECNCEVKTTCDECHCTHCGNDFHLPEELKDFIRDTTKYWNSWLSETDEYFEFSADLEGMVVMIEYMTNQTVGVDECAIKVPEEYRQAMRYFVLYRLLETGQDSMNMSDKFYARFKAERNKILKDRNPLTLSDIEAIMLMK